MKKIFLTLFFCIALCSNAFCESIKETKYSSYDPKLKIFNEENFPVMYNYFLDYAQMFLYKFDITKYPKPNFTHGSKFYLKKDGTLTFYYNPPLSDKEFYQGESGDFRKFILENSPPPFPKEMVDDYIPVCITVVNEAYGEDNSILMQLHKDKYDEYNTLDIDIYKHKKNMHMNKRKCKKLGYEWNEEENYCKLDYKLFLNYEKFETQHK